MVRIDDPITVGTYVTEELAETAADHLRDAGFEDVQVDQASERVWQVQVPWRFADRAKTQLSAQEQRAIQSH